MGCYPATWRIGHAAALSLSSRVGSPASKVRVSGDGFEAGEVVLLRLGSTRVATVRITKSGRFGPVVVSVPAAARPGLLQATAAPKVMVTGQSAITWFTVEVNWAQAQFGPSLNADNSLENLLSPANIQGLRRTWTASPGGTSVSAPAVADGVAYLLSGGGFDVPLNRPGESGDSVF